MKEKELVQKEQAVKRLLNLYEDSKITKSHLSEHVQGHERPKDALIKSIFGSDFSQQLIEKLDSAAFFMNDMYIDKN